MGIINIPLRSDIYRLFPRHLCNSKIRLNLSSTIIKDPHPIFVSCKRRPISLSDPFGWTRLHRSFSQKSSHFMKLHKVNYGHWKVRQFFWLKHLYDYGEIYSDFDNVIDYESFCNCWTLNDSGKFDLYGNNIKWQISSK